MEQVSQPMRILLMATLAFAALWFVALRPKADTGEPAPAQPAAQAAPAPAPAQPKSAIPGGLGDSVDRARSARAAGDASAAQRSEAANGPGTTAAKPSDGPGATTAAKPAGASAKPKGGAPAAVTRALARGHVAVLFFYSSASSDDRMVRGEVAGLSRRGGKVRVWSVPVRKLARYRDVLQGVQILQTPSVLVLRQGKDPVLLAGYTDRAEIDKVTAARLRGR